MDVFQALAQPKRRQILDALGDGPLTAGQLVDVLGEAQPAVSKHLRILRDAGLASSEPDGPVRIYSLNPDGLAAIHDWLQPYRAKWTKALDDLETFLDEQEHQQ